MNERIRELAHKSFDRYDSADGVPVAEFNHEKFAELLIRECADVVRYYYIRGGEPITPQHITRHFGVE
jgi:hypothetical protein